MVSLEPAARYCGEEVKQPCGCICFGRLPRPAFHWTYPTLLVDAVGYAATDFAQRCTTLAKREGGQPTARVNAVLKALAD